MKNYEYIIASLPVIRADVLQGDQVPDVRGIMEDIRGQLDERDNTLVDMVLDGFDSEKLGKEFYEKAFSSRNGFIRDYFHFDLNVRNSKTAYLNASLGRPEGKDILDMGEGDEYEGKQAVETVLSGEDILERERGIDEILNAKIEEITIMKVFDIDVILGFIARLKIADRWFRLNPETGRSMFRKLVSDIKDNYTI